MPLCHHYQWCHHIQLLEIDIGDIKPLQKYGEVDLVAYTFSTVEGIESSMEPSTEAFCGVDSVLGLISAFVW